jgi:hypothetical protein
VSLPEAVLPYLPDGSPDPNLVQRQAATPEHMVWVGASAGSGKTKVLTDRVLRLLLPDPQGRWAGVSSSPNFVHYVYQSCRGGNGTARGQAP